MKKLIAMLLAAAMLASMLALAGCEGKPVDTPDPSTEAEDNIAEESSGFIQLDDSVFDQYLQERDVAVLGSNLIKDPDFSSDQLLWTLYTESGGSATLSKQNEKCVVNVKNGGTVSHSVQIFYDSTKMHQFAHYEWQFTVSCTMPGKMLEARIQLNGGDYAAYAIDYILMTEKPQVVTIPFVMAHATDPAPRLAFNIGSAHDGSEKGADLTNYTVTFDDISLICTDDSQVVEAEAATASDIIVNQLGYSPLEEKTVIFRGLRYVDTFEVLDSNKNVVYTGTATEPQPNIAAWEYNWYGDFSSVTEPGTYTIRAGVLGESCRFTIGDDLYDEAFEDVTRMFYLQRCGCELPEEYAGTFAHAECHTTKARIYGTNTFIDVSGGWHDAGDYGRYVVPAAKTVVDLIMAYNASPDTFGDDCAIPESGNGIPDILDEVRYELEWMLKMQDPSTGGVYHKVTCASFPGNVMPERETDELIVCPVSDYATADFAACMAIASRTYAGLDADFSARCLDAAKLAWEFLEMVKEPLPKGNPAGISTGEYIDYRDTDEHTWASVELYRVTGEEKYHDVIRRYTSFKAYTGFGWTDIGGYAAVSYLTMDKSLQDPALTEKFSAALLSAADAVVAASRNDGYGISLGINYPWGSNMVIANNAMLLLLANDLAANDEYITYAEKHLDYIFGANPMAICYVTGHGSLSPVSTHHRPSISREKTMPGMLVGGADSALEDPYAKTILFNVAPAKCYVDNYNSYSCNEVTIYWNSPLVYIMTRLCEL